MCETCGKGFLSNQHLKEHKLEIHPLPNASKFVCDTCDFSCDSCFVIVNTMVYGLVYYSCPLSYHTSRHTHSTW